MEMKLLDRGRQGQGMSSPGKMIPQRFTRLPIMFCIHQIPSERLYVGWVVEVDNHSARPRRQHQKRRWKLMNSQSLWVASTVKRRPPPRSMYMLCRTTWKRSLDQVVRKKVKIEDFAAHLRTKIKNFRDAFSSAFKIFGGESCSTSQSDDEKKRSHLL
eukprot:TRINITY_DN6390_c0_g1_i1.p1 TRINITY_DN6390_c0_g1~~TRINITY_DN6390_c0_g1_i1.p1  ORF type:complete len:158 (+),score=9.16 TRINITY_DN6390_c0_g1_i1:1375-1848(+)